MNLLLRPLAHIHLCIHPLLAQQYRHQACLPRHSRANNSGVQTLWWYHTGVDRGVSYPALWNDLRGHAFAVAGLCRIERFSLLFA